ncbi:hypothetical protein A2625_02190 [candidate division WOR-1 bacterium RIFCSPHIGHO2_01_FULL_53_15]|uniref:M23ase beta-sheet core domain-containing protein n=1 Tax=candidate division WOR-1 bacterium RIFCSPHIGHO2_01_FULL_53_15 TaxID=1802564 RepID=A0A1F4PYW9_UNCSA|nr:MAG: hypothetical protein A2625_02190 [candidate division WOR-1 bacterium RIFCSPHIGHO2_01_FULL_53_15]OGC10713.1 MAG: hypothetical protein A3D23_00880 [candidate division WOR-1 bacterium RIFCSPHIGHO2_02_FULL_53_26]
MKTTTLFLALSIVIAGQAFAALPKVTIGHAMARQGRSFTVKLVPAEEIAGASAEFLGQKIRFFKNGDEYRAIIGIAPEQKSGKHNLALTIEEDNGRAEKIVKPIKVLPYKFPSVSFWLKPAKKKLLAKDLIAEEWARIEKTLIVESPDQKWQGLFSLPVSGPVSMQFGTKEFVNRQKRGQHRGTDLAVPMGTKVAAPNRGRVVFAEKLKAFGGTMVIDHGQGIHTLYFHLSKFLAEVGEEVGKGEMIALTGNSGISSGPHLHWGMSVHNLRVDPMQWTKTSF